MHRQHKMVWLISQLQRNPFEKQEIDVQTNNVFAKVRKL